jgi:peptidoglycan/LPS O-acetylase OafA/YrhL
MRAIHIVAKTASGVVPHHERRRPYLDWLRVLAVLGVFYAHSIDVLDVVDWRVKYQEQSVGIMILVNIGSVWGMALMFLLAGSSAWFALDARTGAQFIHERIKRLLIPFLVGVLLLSPVEAYFEALRRSLYRGSFLLFVPHFFMSLHIDWNLRWVAAIGYHLWFLAFLFLVSALTLPLLLLLRRKAGRLFLRRLSRVCEARGGLLLFALPFVLIQVMLQLPFPGYQNWGDCFIWWMSFLYGYILASDDGFERAINAQGGIIMLTAALCCLLIGGLYVAGYIARWESGSVYSMGYVLYQVLIGCVIWSLLASVLYMATNRLNFSNRFLSYANEAALPFYIVHYPIVVLSGLYLARWQGGLIMHFLLLSTISLALTWLVYELFIRRIRVLRWLFGMKPPSHEDHAEMLKRKGIA